MNLRRTITFLALLCIITHLSATVVYQQVRVFYSDPTELHKLSKIGIPLDHVRHKKGVFIDVVATREQTDQLRKMGMKIEVLIEDLTKFYQSRFKPSLRSVEGFELGSMGGNYTYDEMTAELDSLHDLYPTLVSEKMSIGLSIKGRDIWAVKLSDNVNKDENVGGDFEPQVLYTGITHAREPLGMMNLIYFMYYLCEHYRTNREVADIVNSRELWFVPCINPDGYVYNESINSTGGGMHRKNRRDTGCGSETRRGVDLNRNYSYDWGADNNGSSPDSCHPTFRGDSAFSEPETAVLRDFMLSKNFKNVLHYHAYSNLLIHSYGDGSLPLEPDLTMLREYGAEMTKFNHYKVGTGLETVGYTVNGDAVDYSYEILGLVSYTPEVGAFSDGFWPATSRIVPLCKENVWPNLYFAKIAGTILTTTNVERREEFIDPGDAVSIAFDIENLGLRASLGSVTATLSPLNNALDLGFIPYTITLGSVEKRDTVDTRIQINTTINSSATIGCRTGLLVEMDDAGKEMHKDTISFLIGVPSFLFSDDAEFGMDLWERSDWGISLSAYEGDFSFTDSPMGDYSSNAVNIMKLNQPIALSDTTRTMITFRARWNIEANYDFVQIQASIDGSSWKSLSGIYTTIGSGEGVQPVGEPGYDGTQRNWIWETIELSDFAGGSEIYMRFILRSDDATQKDGFYFDNLRILSYPAIEFSPGDVTQDCILDVGDIIRMVDLILWPEMSTETEWQLADLNHDSRINVFDIIRVVDLILGK